MNTTMFFIAILGLGILVVCILASKALSHRGNVRVGARLGPGSFFLEVNDEKKDEPKSLTK